MALGKKPIEIVNEGKHQLLVKAKHWNRIYLKEVAKVQNGFAFSSDYFTKEKKGLPLIRIRDIDNDVTVDNYSGNYSKEFIVKRGDILIGMDGDFKVARWKGKDALLNQRVCRIIPNSSSYNEKFLFICLQPFLDAIHADTSSVTVKHLSSKTIEEIPLPYPPIDEQLAIVSKIEELLSELDKGKQQLETAQQQLKVYRQAVLKWAFEGKLSELGRVGLKDDRIMDEAVKGEILQSANPKNPNSDNLPQGWIRTELNKVCEIKRGKSKHRPRNEPSLYGGKYPFIQTGDIRNANGGYITNWTQTYSELGLKQSKLWPKGTLCITIAANIGETAILGFDSCFPDSVVGLLCDEEKLLNKYLNYFFISFKSKLEKLAPATAQKNINVDILENISIPLPQIKEQQIIVEQIESRLSVCDKVEETINQSLAQAETLRQSILKKAFEGKLV